MLNISVRTPVSAKTRAIISIFNCAPCIVALTAFVDVDCNCFGSSPREALEKPVRWSLIWSAYSSILKACAPNWGTANGCTIPC